MGLDTQKYQKDWLPFAVFGYLIRRWLILLMEKARNCLRIKMFCIQEFCFENFKQKWILIIVTFNYLVCYFFNFQRSFSNHLFCFLDLETCPLSYFFFSSPYFISSNSFTLSSSSSSSTFSCVCLACKTLVNDSTYDILFA